MRTDDKYLIPTKATLFGLDIRFRVIDQKLEDEKSKFLHLDTLLEITQIKLSDKQIITNSFNYRKEKHVQEESH